jgi:hypothetical protein
MSKVKKKHKHVTVHCKLSELKHLLIEQDLNLEDHADTIHNINQFDAMTAKGYRLNLLTEEFYKP